MPALDIFTERAEAYMRIIGARIRAGRLSQNMTQADLARACFAPHPSVITHWENGRAIPALPRQFAIADALVLPMPVLWGHNGQSDLALETILADRGAPASPTPTVQAGIRIRAAAVSVHYLSTDCIHDRHGERCKVACPRCGAACRCWCHAVDADEIPAIANGAQERARARAGEGMDGEYAL
jgi:transcriptional regulator with XRE-family HTH domain